MTRRSNAVPYSSLAISAWVVCVVAALGVSSLASIDNGIGG
jgi:hypothetical protein